MYFLLLLDSKCGSPPKVKDGFIKGQEKDAYLSGERVIYDCVNGYTTGQNVNYITCEDSVWTEAPLCKSKHFIFL